MPLDRDAPRLDVSEHPSLEGVHVSHSARVREIDVDFATVTSAQELLKVRLRRRLEIRKQSIDEDLRDRAPSPLALILQMRPGKSEAVPIQDQMDRSGIGREGRGREVVG